jgi:hypothetical protein
VLTSGHPPGQQDAWLFRQGLKGQQGTIYREVSRRYGHLARIGPNDLLTDDPEVMRRMSAARSAYGRSDWYAAMRMNPHRDNMFSTKDTGAHDRLKAQMSFGYGGKENPAIEDHIDEQLTALVALFRRRYLSTEAEFRPADLATIVQYFTLDALTHVAYGKAFGYLATDSDVHSYIATSEAYVPTIVMCAEVPLLRGLLFNPLTLKLVGPRATDTKGIGKLVG